MSRTGWALLLAALLLSHLAACEEGSSTPPPSEGRGQPRPPEGEPRSAQRALWADVDRRQLTTRLKRGLRAPDVALRRLAVRGMGLLRRPSGVEAMRAALRDPDDRVRDHAAFGLGSLGRAARQAGANALLGALAAEADSTLRSHLLWDLGRIGSEGELRAFQTALEAPEAVERAGACRGLFAYGARGRGVPPNLMERVAARMLEDSAAAVRSACAHALGQLPPPVASPDDLPGLTSSLVRALRDEEPEVRMHAVRGLRRYPEVPAQDLVRATADADYRVAVQAFRTLAAIRKGGSDVEMARALRERMDRALAGDSLAGPEMHALTGAMEAAAPFATARSTHGVAVEAWERLGALDEVTPDEARAHCQAARLADMGREWPARVERCGRDRVDREVRGRMAAEVLARAEGARAERAAKLESLFQGSARVRQAVLQAVPSVGHASLNALVLKGLQSEDRGVVTAAAEAVEALAPGWMAAKEEPPDSDGDPGPRPLEPPMARVLEEALDRAVRTLEEADHAPGLVRWLRAGTVLRAEELEPAARRLAAHPNGAVRGRARRLLDALGKQAPEQKTPAPRHPLEPDDFPPRGARWSATVETSRGSVVVELWPDEAPGTVARFAGLAEKGFFDGTPIHRVVPGFAVQGGDPRGDGHGGPPFRVRSEEHRVPFDPGTVGMALAGRDTAGSQFFVTLAWSPQLNGRYTAFGRVTQGMEVVERLQEGDHLVGFEVSRETQ
ncbi:MAG: peptidylprolyl isomerase [Myxococcota bacterium]